jgi:hypothetical protein
MVDVLQFMVLGFSLTGLAIGLLVLKKRRSGDQKAVNYRAFFVIGITFLPAGVALSASTGNSGFFGMSGMGAAFLAIGLMNREKWK